MLQVPQVGPGLVKHLLNLVVLGMLRRNDQGRVVDQLTEVLERLENVASAGALFTASIFPGFDVLDGFALGS